jgi:hypothetical protein
LVLTDAGGPQKVLGAAKSVVRGERKANSLAREGRPEKKQTGCVLITRQGEGLAKQRDKT